MAIRIRNRLLWKVKKTFSFDDYISYKRAQPNVRKVVRTAKGNIGENFVTKLEGKLKYQKYGE